MRVYSELEESPAYPVAEVARYLRISRDRARRWAKALRVDESGREPLSYVNLLELHVLKSLRIGRDVPFQRIRKALDYLRETMPSAHPLLDRNFVTDGLNVLLEHEGGVINLSRGGQVEMREIVGLYLSRIEWQGNARPRFFPFVLVGEQDELRAISIQPTVAFGRPVLAGTGIATEVIAGRFLGGESLSGLAAEYEVPVANLEEAIRWESPLLRVAA